MPEKENTVLEIPEGIPEEFAEVWDEIPEAAREKVGKLMISSTFQMGMLQQPENTIMRKITEDHISEYLQGSREQMNREYDEKRDRKWFLLGSIFLAMVFIIVIICLLKDKPELMEKVIIGIGGAVFGAIGGYGFGKNNSSE